MSEIAEKPAAKQEHATRARVRKSISLDVGIYDAVSEIFEKSGVSFNQAVRLLLLQVAKNKVLPREFGYDIPNDETVAAMNEAREIMVKRAARFRSPDELFDDLTKSAR